MTHAHKTHAPGLYIYVTLRGEWGLNLRYYIYFDSAKQFHFASNTKNFLGDEIVEKKERKTFQ
jgi:hypothetical protein